MLSSEAHRIYKLEIDVSEVKFSFWKVSLREAGKNIA